MALHIQTVTSPYIASAMRLANTIKQNCINLSIVVFILIFLPELLNLLLLKSLFLFLFEVLIDNFFLINII